MSHHRRPEQPAVRLEATAPAECPQTVADPVREDREQPVREYYRDDGGES